MFFYYRPKTKEIVMRSEEKIETDLPFLEYVPTEDEKGMIEQNFNLYEKSGVLQFEKPDHIVQQEKEMELQQIKTDALNITTVKDAQDIIQRLLTFI